MSATNPSNRFIAVSAPSADVTLRYVYTNGSSTETLTRCRGFVILSDGNLAINNDNGDTQTFPVLKGMTIPVATDTIDADTTSDVLVLF